MVSVVIVTYNSARVVPSCLAQLCDGEMDIEIVVVDNNSEDESVSRVLKLAPNSIIVRNGSNLGFAAAVNMGIKASSADVILLLNPDAAITQPTIRSLRNTFAADSALGAIAPLVESTDADGRVIAAGAAPTIWRMFTHMSGLSSLPLRTFRGHYEVSAQVRDADRQIPVDWASGGVLMVRRSALEEIGGLPERWFMYAEDIEMCLRLSDRGWAVRVDPTVRATHETGQSSAGVDGRVSTIWLENLFDLYICRYDPGRVRRTSWAAVVLAGFRCRQLYSGIRHVLGSEVHSYHARRYGVYAAGMARALREQWHSGRQYSGT